jgi:hypothetical protein
MNKVRENVFKLLESSRDARNSDTFLILSYWHLFDGVIAPLPTESSKLTKAESITRARRIIQQDAFIAYMNGDEASKGLLPTDEVWLERREKEHRMREAVKQGEVV